MVLAIFFYVGAEVSVSAGIPLYLQERFGIDINKLGLLGTGLFFTALTIGRFSGGCCSTGCPLERRSSQPASYRSSACSGCSFPTRTIAMASFFLIGLGFANIFPLVFSIAVDTMPEHTNELSGLMVTAIVGGRSCRPLRAHGRPHTVQLSFLVPLAAILYITWTALMNLTTRAQILLFMPDFSDDRRVVMTLDAGRDQFCVLGDAGNRPGSGQFRAAGECARFRGRSTR